MTTIDVHVVVSVTKVRKGWQVSKLVGSETVPVCWFTSSTEAYAYAWIMEHGI